jgi:chromosome segregation ATPase
MATQTELEHVAPKPENRLAQFSKAITDQAIAKMRARYLPLKIQGVQDSAGAAVIHSARMEVKAKRVEVEKVRKALKADSLEYGRKVDAEAKRITGLLEPIENHLDAQEKIYEAEKERIRNAARLKAESEERARREAEEARIRAEREKEEARLKAIRDAEEAELAAKRRRLDAERKEMEAKARAEQEKLAAEARKLDEERGRLAAAEAARVRAIQDERIRKEAAEQAARETEARIAREAETAKRKAEEEAEAKRRAEAAKPTVDKLRNLANAVASVPHPGFDEALDLRVRRILNQAADEIREIAAEMA